MLSRQSSVCLSLLTHTSTLSTLTPHGSVASSSVDCIIAAMDSRSERMSPRFFVPNTFLKGVCWLCIVKMNSHDAPNRKSNLSVVAASSLVDWL